LLILITASGLGLGFTLLKSGQTSLDLGWSCATLGYGGLRVAYSFFAGVLLYRCFTAYGQPVVLFLASRPGFRHNLPWLIVAAVSLILMSRPGPAWRPAFDFIVVIAVFPPLIYLALCLPKNIYGAPLARYLGLVSYPLYALHAPLHSLAVSFLEPWIDSDSPWLALIFAGALLPLCSLLNRYFDAPVRRHLTAYAEAGYMRLGRLKTAPVQDQ